MLIGTDTLPAFTDAALLQTSDMIELDAVSIDAVAGGINPQPLPPSHVERLD